MSRTGAFADIQTETPCPGVRRRTVHGERMTVAEYEFEPGATFPLHRHDQEQVTLVESGEVTLTADGTTQTLRAGWWSVLPGGVEHGLTAGAAGARVVAIVSPRRVDGDLRLSEPR